MDIRVLEDKAALGRVAAESGAKAIRDAIFDRGHAEIILATGASQMEMLSYLVTQPDIAWSEVMVFHLDEYVDLPATHSASFRKYLQERFCDKVAGPGEMNFVQGDADDLETEIARLNNLIRSRTIDVAFVGIGENGHLAFNDPPADFDTELPYFVVELDAACRQQQVGEGWFAQVDDVPSRAITMSVRQILKSKTIIAAIPDRRKADAVRCAVEGDVSNKCPASILKTHSDCRIFLDKSSSSLLKSHP